jgi:C4-dicarboxylate-specific signal transduction histidine kinase
LLSLVLGALVAGGFRWRLNAIREQNIRLETQIAERTSELRDTNTLTRKEIEQRKRAAETALSKRSRRTSSIERFRVMFEECRIGLPWLAWTAVRSRRTPR